MIKFLDLQKQYKMIQQEVAIAIDSVCEAAGFIGGEFVAKFEREFASFIGVNHCIGVGNGTDALEIALQSLKLPENSDILVPANSFIATSEAVSRSGHNVIFVDVEENYLISLETLQKAITKTTRAIIVVHLYGQVCDMERICTFAKEHDLAIIEDCAQAHGAEFKGIKAGAWGDLGTFSFYPGKNLGAYGDAGAITTNNDKLANYIRQYANHGRSSKYDHSFEGRNSRLDGMQAAILSVKLKYLPSWITCRHTIALRYLELLSQVPLKLPLYTSGVHSWHLFVIQTPFRDELRNFLLASQIETGIHYPIALPKLEAYAPFQVKYQDYYACQIDTHLLSLPIGEHLTDEEIEKICQCIQEFFQNKAMI